MDATIVFASFQQYITLDVSTHLPVLSHPPWTYTRDTGLRERTYVYVVMMTEPTTTISKKETVASASTKSLGSVLRYMEGMEVIVELKTGQRHRGILTAADEFMNLTLSLGRTGYEAGHLDRSQHDEEDLSRKQNYSSAVGHYSETLDDVLSSLDIRGPKIRYIHFPDNSDLASMVTMGVERERIAAKKYNRGKRK